MALVGPRVLNYLGESKVKAASIQIESLASALDLYLPRCRPLSVDGSEGLAALVQRPGGVAAWNGPYLKTGSVPNDPWGHPYVYRSPGEHGVYDIISYGPEARRGDGRYGGRCCELDALSDAGQARQSLALDASPSAAREEGFTLLEIVCVLAIIVGLAAIILPAIPRATSRTRLEAYAIETARCSRPTATLPSRRRTVVTQVDAMARSVRSGAPGGGAVPLRTSTSKRCWPPAAISAPPEPPSISSVPECPAAAPSSSRAWVPAIRSGSIG